MEDELREAARRAYERGRWWAALPWAVPVGLAGAVSFGLGVGSASAVALVLGAVVVGFRWRGGALGAAVLPGLIAGSVAWAVPLLGVCRAGCAGPGWECVALCVGAGAGAGLLLHRVPRGVLPGALAVASLCAAMGCLPLGTAGLAGVAAVLGAGATAHGLTAARA